MSAHSSTSRFVGEHAVAVVPNIGNVVERAQQRSRIENRYHPIGAVRATILNYPRLNSYNAAVVSRPGPQIDNGARAATMGPEHFLPRIGDLHRPLCLAGGHGGNDFEWNDLTFAAKATPDQRLDNPNLRHGHLENQRELVLQIIGDLS